VARSEPQPAYLFPYGARFGDDNLVLHARSKRHKVTDFAGPFSVKTVVNGSAAWKVGGRELVVDPHSFLVLGDGEKYSMDIDVPRAMETACAFFRHGFVESVAQDATTTVEASLDQPNRSAPALPYIFRLHADPEHLIVSRAQTLARRCSGELQPSGFEEDFLLLSRSLLLLYEEIRSRLGRVRAAKASTREELFRRLEVGREYIHSYASGPLSLDTVAREACLSRYHFHRLFTQVFQKTPHGYLTEVRLARAHSLLRSGVIIDQVCADVGFSSTSSFQGCSVPSTEPPQAWCGSLEIGKIGHSLPGRVGIGFNYGFTYGQQPEAARQDFNDHRWQPVAEVLQRHSLTVAVQ
jgi:AraC family transcriptional regulator